MIINSFDNKSEEIIKPPHFENATKCDVCIVTFSNEIEDFVVKEFNPKQVGILKCANGTIPIYIFSYKGKTFGFYKTLIGASSAVVFLEEVVGLLETKKIVVFGSAGSLDKNICNNKVIVPTYAYRDEGTSYHYANAEDYIKIKNSPAVSEFMKNNKIPYVEGKVWTTDAFYRETVNNYNKRKVDGCIAVDMECSAMQAVCDFRNLELYYFLISGDILDSAEWDNRELREANHNIGNFNIALELANKI